MTAAPGDLGYLPDFDVDLGPELEAGMAEHRAEIERIAAGPWPPTFADTIEALERAGGRLHLAERLFTDASGSRSTPAIRALEADMLPRLAAHRDAVGLEPRIFARITDLVARRDELALDAERPADGAPAGYGPVSASTTTPLSASPLVPVSMVAR